MVKGSYKDESKASDGERLLALLKESTTRN